MPVLGNPQHEAFAQALASGLTQLQAHAAAGFKPHKGNASALAAKQHIKDRVLEIKQNPGSTASAPAPGQQRERPSSLAAPFKPGQSGNPAGRAKGSRNKLGEAFTVALYEDFQAHGTSVIAKVREDEPAQYMRVVASLLPREVKFEANPVSEMSDDELSSLIDIIRAAGAPRTETSGGTEPPGKPH